ncbi:MAG: hypothetical protein FJ109_10895 [Deltaproteobacteria bacterium]|nr:hypothetical protein [Deltaproteobacteria bacterium]
MVGGGHVHRGIFEVVAERALRPGTLAVFTFVWLAAACGRSPAVVERDFLAPPETTDRAVSADLPDRRSSDEPTVDPGTGQDLVDAALADGSLSDLDSSWDDGAGHDESPPYDLEHCESGPSDGDLPDWPELDGDWGRPPEGTEDPLDVEGDPFGADATCDPFVNCESKECGDDGCGGQCGICDDSVFCTVDSCHPSGQCQHVPAASLCDDGMECTVDDCGMTGCEHLLSPFHCLLMGNCVQSGGADPSDPCKTCQPAVSLIAWTPVEDHAECGAGKVCWKGQCCDAASNCLGKECGDDGCGGTCGSCAPPSLPCVAGKCICTPNCSGNQCGDDGCGGSCGQCCAKQWCLGGICTWPGDECDDKNCTEWDGCTWGHVSEFQVNTEWWSGYQTGARVSGLAEGGFVVVWGGVLPSGVPNDIALQVFGPDGAAPFGHVKVNASDDYGNSLWQEVAPLASGGFVVVWVVKTGLNPPIINLRGQVFNSAGAKLGPEFQINQEEKGYQAHLNVAGLNDGRFIVAWTSEGQDDWGTGNDGILARVFSAAGEPLGPEFIVNTLVAGDQHLGGVTATAGGGALVVWSSEYVDGAGKSVQAQFLDKYCVPKGNEFTVNEQAAFDQQAPKAITLSDGRTLVSFGDSGLFNWLKGQFYDPADAPIGGNVNLVKYWATTGRLAPLVSGGFVLGGEAMWLQMFSPSGQAIGEKIYPAIFEVASDSTPRVAGLADGGFVAVWTSSADQDGDSTGIFAQRFDGEGNKLIH